MGDGQRPSPAHIFERRTRSWWLVVPGQVSTSLFTPGTMVYLFADRFDSPASGSQEDSIASGTVGEDGRVVFLGHSQPGSLVWLAGEVTHAGWTAVRTFWRRTPGHSLEER